MSTSTLTHNIRPIEKKIGVRPLRIGLFGFGVVGTGVVKILQEKRQEFVRQFKTDISIERICVRDEVKVREAVYPSDRITTDPRDLIEDDSIDCIIEVIGGEFEARDIILRSLRNRKHVITANKLLLSYDIEYLRQTAFRTGVQLLYAASVCGSVPVLRAIDELASSDTIRSIRGIVNGSTNFILTAMSQEGLSYEEACREARRLGFLEADPTLDVSGADATQKLSVLIYHAFGAHLLPSDIKREGIEGVTADDFVRAKAEQATIKLIAHASCDRFAKIEANVAPEIVPLSHIFANTQNEFNALEITADHAGPQLLYGKGAGSLPTASAVVSDLLELVKD